MLIIITIWENNIKRFRTHVALRKIIKKAKLNAIKLVPFMTKGRGISPSMSRTLIIGAM